MENETLTLDGRRPPANGVSPPAASGGLEAALGPGGGPSGGGPSLGAASSTTARRRTPGRWRRIPRVVSAASQPPSQLRLADLVRPGLARA